MQNHRPIDVQAVSSRFALSDKSPSGIVWRSGPKAGKTAGCMVDRGYKIYWQICFHGKTYYVSRIKWAIENQADPGLIEVKS